MILIGWEALLEFGQFQVPCFFLEHLISKVDHLQGLIFFLLQLGVVERKDDIRIPMCVYLEPK